ncbi:hypothetical protein HDU79_001910 [Rhizoclosmatium sp. JEL0117]|nr:hypothetical protein HDU79_001910 [Rhizoclosmatium sp. JEL0117]
MTSTGGPSLVETNNTSMRIEDPVVTKIKNSLEYDYIVLFGDSLTEKGVNAMGGWGQRMIQNYSRKAIVLVHGFGFYNSYWLKFVIEPLLRDIPSHRVKLMTLLVGTNDLSSETMPQHVPLEKYYQYLEEIILTMHTSAPQSRILVMTPPPSRGKAHTIEDSILYRDACLETVAKIRKNVSQPWAKKQLQTLNTWDVFMPEKRYKLPGFQTKEWNPFFSDGIHFSELGNERLFTGVIQKIHETWPELISKRMKSIVVDAGLLPGPAALEENDEATKWWLFERM